MVIVFVAILVMVMGEEGCDFFLDTIKECNGIYRKVDEYDLQLNQQFENDMRLFYLAIARGIPAIRPAFPNFCRMQCSGNGIDDFRRRFFKRQLSRTS
ncbi:unnamed protein product [Bursaphelenchus xylophilus]|uniref:(pine wood nematode) hypothetical protein n=1 Tax=Bursaphelenchus xylophilus TaxID=6326 RepID=A0A1I7RTM3_BURXY|nr:unnamed protein product [Bursaphelenchus xylophilus]CAG9122320.1 unnamed protein product [Bursaphelenchus xylophilus]